MKTTLESIGKAKTLQPPGEGIMDNWRRTRRVDWEDKMQRWKRNGSGWWSQRKIVGGTDGKVRGRWKMEREKKVT